MSVLLDLKLYSVEKQCTTDYYCSQGKIVLVTDAGLVRGASCCFLRSLMICFD